MGSTSRQGVSTAQQRSGKSQAAESYTRCPPDMERSGVWPGAPMEGIWRWARRTGQLVSSKF